MLRGQYFGAVVGNFLGQLTRPGIHRAGHSLGCSRRRRCWQLDNVVRLGHFRLLHRFRLLCLLGGLAGGLGQLVLDVRPRVLDLVEPAHTGVQPGIDDAEIISLGARLGTGQRGQQGFKVVDKRAIEMQTYTLGNAFDGVQDSSHYSVCVIRGDVSLPGGHRILELLQLGRALFYKGLQEVGEYFTTTGTGVGKCDASRDT